VTGLPFLAPGRTAVVTGAADGIGRAAALRLAGMGVNVVLADRNRDRLEEAVDETRAAARHDAEATGLPTDVSDYDQVCALRRFAFERFGDVGLLMNNAGVGGGGHAFENPDAWRRVLAVNLFGVINGVQAFTAEMIAQGRPAAIVNTGSKQGITTPPGDTAYNVSKAGVKVLTEGLAHTLRNTPGCQVQAHLLVPGFVFTGLTRRRTAEKPAGAWTAEQTIDFALERMSAGDFYIVCPDNEVTRAIDNARITWAAQDITQNRPPLSRWHPDWQEDFAAWLAEEVPGS
jgi:NAD(P)-dependent dehydrogenase (short-subunit alcohol dehydrogenase family)